MTTLARATLIGVALVALGAAFSAGGSNAADLLAQAEPPTSQPAADSPDTPPAPDPAPVDQSLLSEGESLFSEHCAACHQSNGQGIPGTFPPLAGNSVLQDPQTIVEILKHGKSGDITVEGHTFNNTMPPIGSNFSDEQIAAVATYVRNSFGNGFGGVSVADVQQILSSGQ